MKTDGFNVLSSAGSDWRILKLLLINHLGRCASPRQFEATKLSFWYILPKLIQQLRHILVNSRLFGHGVVVAYSSMVSTLKSAYFCDFGIVWGGSIRSRRRSDAADGDLASLKSVAVSRGSMVRA